MNKIEEHLKTNNNMGFMHPISEIGEKFLHFSKDNSPIIEMGCAYGNIVTEALRKGTKEIIACDMEREHLEILKQKTRSFSGSLQTNLGRFPEDFNFRENSIAGIHASHILEFLDGKELTMGLNKFYNWLVPKGKLFILCYSIFINGLNNTIFKNEYEKRKKKFIEWPGYFENLNNYVMTNNKNIDSDDDPLPPNLHIYEKDILTNGLKKAGFAIEFSKYLDGRKNGAVEKSLLDGREYLGIIAHKDNCIEQ